MFTKRFFIPLITLVVSFTAHAAVPPALPGLAPLNIAAPVLPPLLIAVCDNNIAAANAIIQASADQSAAVSEELNDNLETALSIAAVKGYVDLVNLVMGYHPSFDCITNALKRTTRHALGLLEWHNDARPQLSAMFIMLARSQFNPAELHAHAQIDFIWSHNNNARLLLATVYQLVVNAFNQQQQINQAKQNHNHHSDQGPSAGAACK